MPRFKDGQDKKQELPVKQSGSNRVAAGKTVARPIHEWAVDERAMPMNNDLDPLVQKHAARNSNDQRHKRWPPSFPDEEQHQGTKNDCDPFPGAKLGECAQNAHERRGETLMKPCRDSVIGTPERIPNGQRRIGSLEGRQCVYHRKADEAYSQ